MQEQPAPGYGQEFGEIPRESVLENGLAGSQVEPALEHSQEVMPEAATDEQLLEAPPAEVYPDNY